jgi:hypothetical protein
MNVTLDENDIRLAAHVAFDRGYTSLIKGMVNRNGGKDDPFYRHVIGALGECAFAKAMGIYWDGSVGRFAGQGADVGTFQIRTRSEALPLIIRPADGDTDVFVLVHRGSDMTQWKLAGWMRGAEAKRCGILTDMQGGQRYLVDAEILHPMADLWEPA